MEAPARFPVSEDDLAHWAVYADWLQTRGDPRGELIALELSLPAAPDRESVAAFHALARRFLRERKHAPISWCLGHARTLQVAMRYPSTRWPDSNDAVLLASARDFLRTEPGRYLERLRVPFGVYNGSPPWQRLLAALPATCRELSLDVLAWDAGSATALRRDLPESVRELEVRGPWPPDPDKHAHEVFISDRLDLVEFPEQIIEHFMSLRLARGLARTRKVRIVVDEVRSARLPPGRWALGRPGDAALVMPHHRRAVRLRRADLLRLQRRWGAIPVRTQLAARIPAGYRLGVFEGDLHVEPRGTTLVRRGDDWTLRAGEHETTHNGTRLAPGQIVPLADGDLFALSGSQCMFLSRDAPRRAIEVLDM